MVGKPGASPYVHTLVAWPAKKCSQLRAPFVGASRETRVYVKSDENFEV